MLEEVANGAEIVTADVTITLVVPLGCSSPADNKSQCRTKSYEEYILATYFASTRAKWTIRDFPLPHGSIR